MYHDVEREPLPFFLREISQKKLSGHLYVTAKDFHISLNFLDGKLANGMSTRFDEKLSVILHLMGNINEEQYNFLSGLHQFSDDQVAGILVDQNFAKKKDIYYARIFQLRRIAISTFALQRGNWIFTAGEPDPPLREVFEIPLAGILVEGARSVDHVSFYAGKWQRHTPVLFPEIPLDIEIYFTDAERAFYTALQQQGAYSCQELIARLNMIPLEFWRSVLAFHLLGIVEFEKGEEGPDLSAEIAALLELNQLMQDPAATGPALLGLPADASAADVERARARFLARFAPERFGSAAAPQIKKIANAVCLHLQALEAAPGPAPQPRLLSREEIVVESPKWTGPELLGEKNIIVEPPKPAAPRELRDEDIIVVPPKWTGPELRGEEDIIVEAQEPAGPGWLREEDILAQTPAGAEPELLGEEDIIVEAQEPAEPELLSEEDMIVDSTDEVELLREQDIIAESPRAIEPELLRTGDMQPEPEASEFNTPVPQEVEPASSEPKPPVRLEVEPELEIQVEIEPEPPARQEAALEHSVQAPPRQFVPDALPTSLRTANIDHEKAWNMMLQSKELYEKHEYAKAIPLLKKAIRLESNQGDYYYLLGLCQGETELTHNEAEMNLKKAIEYKSWSADPVYALGVLYRREGKMKLAERCFQRVKEIAYEHTGASRALVDLRRRKTTGRPSSPPKKKR